MLETEFDEFLRSNTYKVLQCMIEHEVTNKSNELTEILLHNSLTAEKLKELTDQTCGLIAGLNALRDKETFKSIMNEYELLELEDDTEE